MKTKPEISGRRSYRLGARAVAAEATLARVMQAFITLMQNRWFDQITLDEVASAAGVTVQTVIRRFGGKDGLLEAARDHLGDEIRERRNVRSGDIEHAVDVLIKDYEAQGDLVLRLLAQEERYPALSVVCDYGRAEHRAWIADICAPYVSKLPQGAQRDCVDGLVVATDIYTWKLLRRDMKRSAAKYKAQVLQMVGAILGPGGVQ
jgi:AcrR family transcriptional regulator